MYFVSVLKCDILKNVPPFSSNIRKISLSLNGILCNLISCNIYTTNSVIYVLYYLGSRVPKEI